MPPCSTHVRHHRPTFPIQFLPDPRISLVNILPMAQPLLHKAQVTHREQKQRTHSCLSPSSSEASFPWPEWPTSTPAVTLMALAQLSHLPFSLWLNTHYNGIVCGEKWLDKTVPGKKCLDEMEERNRNVMNWHNPSHVLQTVPLSLLLAHGQAQTKSESVYPFPRNNIVPTSQQRENNFWNVSRAMECRPVLVSRFLFGELLGMYQR